MRKLALCLGIILLAMGTAVAFAADVTGTWTAQMKGPDGDGFTIAFHFKQDGEKLTGTVDGPQGEPLEVSDGKVQGDKISFAIRMSRGGEEGPKMIHEGAIKGEEISLTMKMEGGREGGPGGPGGGPGGPGGPGPREPMILKRSK